MTLGVVSKFSWNLGTSTARLVRALTSCLKSTTHKTEPVIGKCAIVASQISQHTVKAKYQTGKLSFETWGP